MLLSCRRGTGNTHGRPSREADRRPRRRSGRVHDVDADGMHVRRADHCGRWQRRPRRHPGRLPGAGQAVERERGARGSTVGPSGTVDLDTVSEPVSGFLVFGYEVLQGTSSDGSTTGDDVYPAPTLRVDPGERLIIHYDNDLRNLTIEDFYDPAFTPAGGGEVPIYPPGPRIGAAEPAHPRCAREPGRQRRQRAARHSRRNGQRLRLRGTEGHAERPVLVPQPPSHDDRAADVRGARGTAGDRQARRQPSPGDAERRTHPRHGPAVQLRLRP